MPSPFPGMDPYLEDPAVWSDFHGTFLIGLRAELNRLLPRNYVARWERYVWIDDADEQELRLLGEPDAFVADKASTEPPLEPNSQLAAPATITLPVVEPKGKGFLKIIDVHSRRVVTVIEMLSPANKRGGKDRDVYLAKRQEYFIARTNLVEFDFLRSGQRPPVIGSRPMADYYVIVSRAADYPAAGIWPLTVRDSIPPMPVPLLPQEKPIWLPIRPSMDRAYDEGRLDEDIDYTQPPVPPLTEPDATWARELLAQRVP